MPDPLVVLEGIRNEDGLITDFCYRLANTAACDFLRCHWTELLHRTLLAQHPQVTSNGLLQRFARCVDAGESLSLDYFVYLDPSSGAARTYDIQGRSAGHDLLCLTWRDVTERYRYQQQLAESEQLLRLVVENSADVLATFKNGLITWVSPSVEEASGRTPASLVGTPATTLVAPEDADLAQRIVAENDHDNNDPGLSRMRLYDADNNLRWVEVNAKTFYDSQGNADGRTASIRTIDDLVVAEQETERERDRRSEAEQLYRQLLDNSIIATGLLNADGRFLRVNKAMCDFFGYDALTLSAKTWQDLTAPEYRDTGLRAVRDMIAGRRDSYRIRKQYIHAAGHRIWGDLSVSYIPESDGPSQYGIAQIIDITAEAESRRRLAEGERETRAIASRLAAELSSAARYVASILPGRLEGQVPVSSRYLPAEELGGDCFDYRWIDDDHLVVYLIDVSGHGIGPALLAVSLHNLLRSGTLPHDVLLAPEHVLSELNRRFQMDLHDGKYFTIWYGVYQKSTGLLRYSSAGHPPALGLAVERGSITAIPLATEAQPMGMFDDTVFSAASYQVPRGGKILVYSDGAFELTCTDGRQWSCLHFMQLCAELAGRPGWSLDDLVSRLQSITAAGLNEDDCSLILLNFP